MFIINTNITIRMAWNLLGESETALVYFNRAVTDCVDGGELQLLAQVGGNVGQVSTRQNNGIGILSTAAEGRKQ